MSTAAQIWIFQANPRLYNIDQALLSLPEMTWLVSSHKEHIGPGDKVFLWKSGPEAAIIAEASVLAPPSILHASEKELQGFQPSACSRYDVGRRVPKARTSP